MAQTQDYKDPKYSNDTVFQLINREYLTLNEETIKINNEHLKVVIEQNFVPLMKKNELFALLYRRIMYGGSFYKGTKFGKPEEFDLDFIIALPINYSKITIDTKHGHFGFVKIKINVAEIQQNPNWVKHSNTLSKWLTVDNYLDQNKFRQWVESIFTSAFALLPRTESGYQNRTYVIKHKKSGPAFTLEIKTPEGSTIDVDLVPSLEFNVPLSNGYKPIQEDKKTWMVVAKPLSNITNGNILWRLCFYEVEKTILKGDVKPVIRMMKKFRDTMQWKSIASYYIETIFYHELEKHKNDLENFLKAPKTCLFMLGLKKLQNALASHRLPYYWHHQYNLFSKINTTELDNYASRLQRIINMIESKIETDRFVLADIVLETTEAQRIKHGY